MCATASQSTFPNTVTSSKLLSFDLCKRKVQTAVSTYANTVPRTVGRNVHTHTSCHSDVKVTFEEVFKEKERITRQDMVTRGAAKG